MLRGTEKVTDQPLPVWCGEKKFTIFNQNSAHLCNTASIVTYMFEHMMTVAEVHDTIPERQMRSVSTYQMNLSSKSLKLG
jgi:hypothetical protein